MKPEEGGRQCLRSWSPPARGRGLKPNRWPWSLCRRRSPPARGRGLKPDGGGVAGGAGGSPPARGRGLKLCTLAQDTHFARVAPRAGAWIETRHRHALHTIRQSPPARGRGLKPCKQRSVVCQALSPPARGRGLKHRWATRSRPGLPVAPRAGAWIETFRSQHPQQRHCVAPRAGAWIETAPQSPPPSAACCRPPRGGVD